MEAATRATALVRPVGGRRAGDSLAGDDAHKLAILRTLLLKLDVPVFFREQRVITTDADVPACMDGCAALPDDDIAGDHFLATK